MDVNSFINDTRCSSTIKKNEMIRCRMITTWKFICMHDECILSIPNEIHIYYAHMLTHYRCGRSQYR